MGHNSFDKKSIKGEKLLYIVLYLHYAKVRFQSQIIQQKLDSRVK